MQSFDTECPDNVDFVRSEPVVTVGPTEHLPVGSCKIVELPDARELAVFNINGEFYAINNFCPHRGAPLAQGLICGHVVECDWHGWRFDLQTGECLTVDEKVETYRVVIDDGIIKVIV